MMNHKYRRVIYHGALNEKYGEMEIIEQWFNKLAGTKEQKVEGRVVTPHIYYFSLYRPLLDEMVEFTLQKEES